MKYDPENLIIVRDASNLFLHSRELLEHYDMRKKYLRLEAQNSTNWNGYVLAN